MNVTLPDREDALQRLRACWAVWLLLKVSYVAFAFGGHLLPIPRAVVGKCRQTSHLVNNGFVGAWLHSRCGSGGVCAGGCQRQPQMPFVVSKSGFFWCPGQAAAQADGDACFALCSPTRTLGSWATLEQPAVAGEH